MCGKVESQTPFKENSNTFTCVLQIQFWNVENVVAMTKNREILLNVRD